MFKKLLLSSVFALFAFATYGQTIVSTSPENRNVVLEEFTGIHCVYCPQGHAIAQGIQDSHPGDVFLINIHTGGYANPNPGEPDFRTRYGAAIAAQSELLGYPAATVNRENFPGMEMGDPGTTALDRSNWASASDQVLADASYLNMAVTADVDAATNVMNIHVEAYYTGDSPESTNLLNVAILQNNTAGPQTGGGSGNNYNHMHRLIDMVTGQWGETINQTTSGTFIERDYAYPIIPHNNYVPVELDDLEVVVFMTETHQQIISGSGTLPTFTVVNNNDANIRYVEDFGSGCIGEQFDFTPKVNIQNAGTDPITSLDIEYSINGSSDTYSWSGNIASLESETIELPQISLTLLGTNVFEVSTPSDDNNSNNTISVPFGVDASGTLDLTIETDDHGSQVRWKIRDSGGTIILHGGPYPDNTTINERLYVDEDCYTFELADTGSDGGNVVTLEDHNGVLIFHTDGDYGQKVTTKFHSDGVLGTSEVDLQNVSIYPNPASTILNVKSAENANIQVYNILGQEVMAKTGIAMDEQLNVSALQSGTYFIKIAKDSQVTTKRFIVSN
jgi:hypothetical protein